MNEHDESPKPQEIPLTPDERMRRMSRRSFIWTAVAIGGSFAAWKWLVSQPAEGGLAAPLRRALLANEALTNSTYGVGKLSPEFSASAIEPLRFNGGVGLDGEVDLASYRLILEVPGLAAQSLRLDELRQLPNRSYITELRCVEGWSRVFQWGGWRISEFLERFAPGDDSPYMSMETPDGKYFVGLDRESFMHPQSLLCFEMNGAPLANKHGAPLRLAMPVKYGYKQIKRIGRIRLMAERPKDYWAERGYDWFAAL